MIYVYDASFVGALIIPDEKTSHAEKLDASISKNDSIIVPQLLWFEVANIFKNLIRQRRYPYEEVLGFFPTLVKLHLTSDSEIGAALSERLLRIAQDYNLSSYDAAYLELAGRKKAVLCTLDNNLRAAAEKYGVALLK
jgi:predicted nucleic acid-binding protein